MDTDLTGSARPEIVLGISGRTCSGKTTLARLLMEKGFVTVSFRDVLERLIQQRGVPITRQALRELGLEVRLTRGQRWLQSSVRHEVSEISARRVAIDGLRFPEDHEFFTGTYGSRFRHVHLEASEHVRRTRFRARGGTDEEFEYARNHETEMFAEAVGALADLVIRNDGSIGELRKSVSQSLLPIVGEG
jgi:dephospho-CoA kinase